MLKGELEARGLSAHALAIALRLPASRISQIVRGQRAITPETALRLARYLGGSAAIWLRLQVAYDAPKPNSLRRSKLRSRQPSLNWIKNIRCRRYQMNVGLPVNMQRLLVCPMRVGTSGDLVWVLV
jgi:addiction module HigA family antidote